MDKQPVGTSIQWNIIQWYKKQAIKPPKDMEEP